MTDNRRETFPRTSAKPHSTRGKWRKSAHQIFYGDRAMPGRHTVRGSKAIRKSGSDAQAVIGHSGRPGPEKAVGARHWIGWETGWPKASHRLGRNSSRSL